MSWRGHTILKSPTDPWMYCEIIDRTRPNTIIETGTWEGGSAIFMRDMCRVRGLNTQVVTIDIAPRKTPECEGVRYITASSVDASVLRDVERLPHPWLVILDSDHRFPHVLEELRQYSPMLKPGEFLIVEDTVDLDEDGPRKAIDKFLSDRGGFEVCPEFERLGLSFNVGGYLRKL